MPEKIIKKIITTDENASDNEISSNEDHHDHELVNSDNDNRRFLNWFIANFVTGFLLSVVFMVLLVRNQSKSAVIAPKNELTTSGSFPIHANFFSIENKKFWLKQPKFLIDPSITHPEDRAQAQALIKQLKSIFAAMKLSITQEMTLSKTTIRLLPSAMINPPDKAISYGFVLQPREIVIALQKDLSKAELRSTLLSQIHHVTVYEINLNKLHDEAKTKTILEYPFLNEQGAIDNSLRAELSFAIDELTNNVKEFFSLEANKYRNPVAEKRFIRYLETIKDYQPMVYRVKSHISDREVDVVELENNLGMLYRNNRPIVYQGAGEIQLLCSANKDKSPLELARAFFYDYSRAYKNLKASYLSRDKNIAAGEYLIHNKFLVEFSSAIDAMLTPKMKQVFAERFTRYFDNYAETYVSGLAEENITDLLQTRYSA